MDGSSGRVTGATRRDSGDKRDASEAAAVPGSVADVRAREAACSRFGGPQRRPDPQALPALSVRREGSPACVSGAGVKRGTHNAKPRRCEQTLSLENDSLTTHRRKRAESSTTGVVVPHQTHARVYLLPPARWKQAKLSPHDRSVDWECMVPSSAHRRRSAPMRHVFSGRRSPLAPWGRSTGRLLAQWTAARTASLQREIAQAGAVQTLRRLATRRLVIAALLTVSLAAAFALGGIGRIDKQSATAAVNAPLRATSRVTAVAVAMPQVAPLISPELIVATARVENDLAPTAPSAERLLSEVSTMDLMMPIAEPDLDIRSRHNLWEQIGKAYGIDPLLLYSVALVESKSLYPDGRIAPTPWLFRVDDHLVRGDRKHVQLQMAAASQFGSAVQDVGIMQVYYPMHRDAVRDPLTLLDPRTNISVGAKILRDGMRRTRDRVMGVGYYHSRTPSLAKGYGTAVLTVYERLKSEHRTSRQRNAVAR